MPVAFRTSSEQGCSSTIRMSKDLAQVLRPRKVVEKCFNFRPSQRAQNPTTSWRMDVKASDIRTPTYELASQVRERGKVERHPDPAFIYAAFRAELD